MKSIRFHIISNLYKINYRTISHSVNVGKTTLNSFRNKLDNGPKLKDFIYKPKKNTIPSEDAIPYIEDITKSGCGRKVYFDIYGCQMNVNDADIIWTILQKHGYDKTKQLKEADVILLVTCSIRENAESKIWGRLDYLRGYFKHRPRNKPTLKIGLLGCMARRLKDQILEDKKLVDFIAGPDAYRSLPHLLALTHNDQKSINVLLSTEETYADLTPVRLNEDSRTAFVSIMRGCDNMCTYCIVPFTRGRERSRPLQSILHEIEQLAQNGVKEVTLLGQNVNSYRDLTTTKQMEYTQLARGFNTVYKPKIGGLRFGELLRNVAELVPEMRIRFTSPHPKDFPDDVLDVIATYPNVCNSLHLPAQSGNSAVLERMRRGYTRESYLELVEHIRAKLPNVAFSSDFICGFCDETEQEFQDTLTLLDQVKYNTAYLFEYSMREKTAAHRRYQDNVSDLVKNARLKRMIEIYRKHCETLNRQQIGKTHLILIEGYSKRSKLYLAGRNDHNIKVIVPCGDIPDDEGNLKTLEPGDFVAVQINAANSQVLKGIPLYRTKLQNFYKQSTQLYYNSLL